MRHPLGIGATGVELQRSADAETAPLTRSVRQLVEHQSESDMLDA